MESGFGGESTIDDPAPVGRYLMLHADNWAGQCCNGTSIWEIVVDAEPGVLEDSDNDGLPDSYEQTIIDHDPDDAVDGFDDVAGPNDAPVTTDFDDDGATDTQEFQRSTDPVDPDTDDDTLLDGVETGTGVWVGTDDTGTNPKRVPRRRAGDRPLIVPGQVAAIGIALWQDEPKEPNPRPVTEDQGGQKGVAFPPDSLHESCGTY